MGGICRITGLYIIKFGLQKKTGTDSGREEHEQMIDNEWYNPDEEAMKNGVLLEIMWALSTLKK